MQRSTILEGYTKYFIKPVSLEGMIKITKQMQYNICKIYKPDINGTGFLCNLPYNSVKIPFLVTNNHIINEKDIENNKTITISFNIEGNEKIKKISLDKTRIILTNKNKDFDFTIIEIKNEDNINIENIYEIEENINIDEECLRNKYTDESVYTLHYPKGDNIEASFGLIKGINDKKIQHSCWTEGGSSGAPILNLKNSKVVGIHFGFKKNLNEATFIKSVILELSKYKNNNISQNNNQQLLQLNVNYNLLNNNVKEQEKIIFKKENSSPIIAFPEEDSQRYNIIFIDSSNSKTNIIIPIDKDISKLFDIYLENRKVKDISKDEILFVYNGSFIDINQNIKIKEVFQNFSKLTVINKK